MIEKKTRPVTLKWTENPKGGMRRVKKKREGERTGNQKKKETGPENRGGKDAEILSQGAGIYRLCIARKLKEGVTGGGDFRQGALKEETWMGTQNNLRFVLRGGKEIRNGVRKAWQTGLPNQNDIG